MKRDKSSEAGKNGTGRSPSLPLSGLEGFHQQRMGPLGSIYDGRLSSRCSADKSMQSLTRNSLTNQLPLCNRRRAHMKASLVLTTMVLLASSLFAGDSKDYPNVAEWKLKNTGYQHQSLGQHATGRRRRVSMNRPAESGTLASMAKNGNLQKTRTPTMERTARRLLSCTIKSFGRR
jgi:hypothetical protein